MDAAEWDARYAAGPELAWGAEPNRFVVQEVGDLPPGRALDLGAGEGRNSVWLAQRGWQVTAVDFSHVGLEKGRGLEELAAERAGRPLPAVSWDLADVRTYVPAHGAFQLVLAAYLQLPAHERREVMRRAAEGLAPGGVLLVVAHDSSNIADGYGGPQDPSVLFTPDDVLSDLAGVDGLEVEKAEKVRRPVETPDGTRHAIDVLVRVARVAPA